MAGTYSCNIEPSSPYGTIFSGEWGIRSRPRAATAKHSRAANAHDFSPTILGVFLTSARAGIFCLLAVQDAIAASRRVQPGVHGYGERCPFRTTYSVLLF